MDDNKKKTAAISAVMRYIKEEEDRAGLLPGESSAAPQGTFIPMNLWGVSGRQAQMQLRNLMQLKAFHGLKFR